LSRGGAKGAKPEAPQRKCIVTGVTGDKAALVRFVAGPDATLYPDIEGKLPGRGLYVASNRKALEKAIRVGRFAKAAEMAVTVPGDLPDLVESLLAKRVLAFLGLAQRTGLISTGFERVKAAIDDDLAGVKRLACLIEASDGAEDGRRNILAKARATELEAPVCGQFTCAELSMALGLGNVIHACLSGGGSGAALSARVLAELDRLSGFRPMTPPDWGVVPARSGETE